MLKWLKKRIRDWLFEEEYASDEIEVYGADGRIETLAVLGVEGLYLKCLDTQQGERLVSKEQVVNSKQFQVVWQRKAGFRLVWEDGELYDLH